MDERDPVARELAELARAWFGTPLDSTGPVPEEAIVAAERELGVAFPKSYRTFLRHHGAGSLHYYKIFGIPGGRLCGDVVRMNQLASRRLPKHYVKFTNDVGDFAYYLDTSQVNSDGECPVVVFGPGDAGEIVADSFFDFLRRASQSVIAEQDRR